MTRRSLFGALAALPFVGALVGKVAAESSETARFTLGTTQSFYASSGVSNIRMENCRFSNGMDVDVTHVPKEMAKGRQMCLQVGETVSVPDVKEFGL